jgi:hypothetical protein
MRGGMEELAHRGILDDLALIEHGQVIADLGHHAQIMRDEQDGRAVPGLHALDQAQDLFLHRDIQRGGGFIRHDQFRLGGEGGGDQDALAHAA